MSQDDGQTTVESVEELEKRLGSKDTDDANDVLETPSEAEDQNEAASGEDQENPSDDNDNDDDQEDPYGPAVSQALSNAGLDADEVGKHFLEHGDLTPEHFEALEKAGFRRDLVNVYLNGLKTMSAEGAAIAQSEIDAIVSSVGGVNEYKKMAIWAHGGGVPADEVKNFDDTVSSGNTYQAQLAVNDLYAKFVKATGSTPAPRPGKPKGDGGVQKFSSQAEVVAAMKDPRYQSGDKAYIKLVSDRLAGSDVFRKN